MMKTTGNLDIRRVKDVVFGDLNKLLNSFDIDYEIFDDNYHCKCPIHEASDNDKAVSISIPKRSWRCWTRGCHEQYGTDIFGFVSGILSRRQVKEATFSDALRYICGVYNVGGDFARVNTTTTTPNPNQDFCDIVKVFHENRTHNNLSIRSGGDGGLQLHTGYIRTNSSVDLRPSDYFLRRGYSESVLQTFGVTDCYDKQSPFYLRSTIPVENLNGTQIGVIARATKDWILPKYIFTKGIVKSLYLYNYHRAIEKAQELGALFICEGQGDVWRLWEAGVHNAVGIFGKEISSEQKTLLLNSGITTIVVVTDNDQAGRESKIKIQRELNRYFTVKFPRFKTKDIGMMSVARVNSDILTQVQGLY